MLQKTDIGRHAAAALRNGGERAQNAAVQLARIGLSADVKAFLKAEGRCEHAVELIYFCSVAVEQIQQAGLRAGRAAAAQKADPRQCEIHLINVEEDILQPQRRALADRDGLSGLIMGVAQRGQRLVPLRERGQIGGEVQQLRPNAEQRLAIQNQIGVIRHIAARRAEVNDARCFRGGGAVCVDVRHHVMTHLLFPPRGKVKVDVVDVCLQRSDLRRRDRKDEHMLGAGQLRPQAPPRFDPRAL